MGAAALHLPCSALSAATLHAWGLMGGRRKWGWVGVLHCGTRGGAATWLRAVQEKPLVPSAMVGLHQGWRHLWSSHPDSHEGRMSANELA